MIPCYINWFIGDYYEIVIYISNYMHLQRILDLSLDTFQSWQLFPVVAFSVSSGQTRAGKALATDQPTCRRRPRKGIHRSLSGDVAVYVTIAPREGGIDRCRENAETTAGKFVHIGKLDRHFP